jgi:2-dehydropantoate 2-reductase
VRILVFGAGVIGSVYAVKLLQAGHEVVMLARGRRLSDLQTHGLVLEEAKSGNRTVLAVQWWESLRQTTGTRWCWSASGPSSLRARYPS